MPAAKILAVHEAHRISVEEGMRLGVRDSVGKLLVQGIERRRVVGQLIVGNGGTPKEVATGMGKSGARVWGHRMSLREGAAAAYPRLVAAAC
jgi:hypothetical protein